MCRLGLVLFNKEKLETSRDNFDRYDVSNHRNVSDLGVHWSVLNG